VPRQGQEPPFTSPSGGQRILRDAHAETTPSARQLQINHRDRVSVNTERWRRRQERLVLPTGRGVRRKPPLPPRQQLRFDPLDAGRRVVVDGGGEPLTVTAVAARKPTALAVGGSA
jgi:hypothetical protein